MRRVGVGANTAKKKTDAEVALEKEVKSLKADVKQLKAENKKLQEENAQLKGEKPETAAQE